MTSLSFVLRLNAASCLGFGILFVILPGNVSMMLGSAPPNILSGLGVILVVNGVHLVVASMRARPIPLEILWFSLGDMAWWLATLTLVAAGAWITNPTGTAVALVVALFVAGLGLSQLLHLGHHRSGLWRREHWRRIGESWMSLPLWVKTWLFALNAVFLLSPVFLPWEAARIVLIAYVASGPLLGAFAVFEGGLTRAMGIAHLVPWVPMLVWLMIWIATSDTLGIARGYAVLLVTMTVICLAFDVYDILRWLRGERAVLSASRANSTKPRRGPV